MTDEAATIVVDIDKLIRAQRKRTGRGFNVMSTATAVRKSGTPRFPERLQFRCPPALTTMLAAAAIKEMTTASDYVRRAVVLRLREDGYQLRDSATE